MPVFAILNPSLRILPYNNIYCWQAKDGGFKVKCIIYPQCKGFLVILLQVSTLAGFELKRICKQGTGQKIGEIVYCSTRNSANMVYRTLPDKL